MHEQQDIDMEEALEERRNAEASAGFSGRGAEGDFKIGYDTHHAVKGPGENWDQEKFKRKPAKKGVEEACMVETLEDPGKFLQAYFLQWSDTEVHLRIPVSNQAERREWINLKSSRLWRGQMHMKFWRHISNGVWVPRPQKSKAGQSKKRKARPEEPLRRGGRYDAAQATESEDQQPERPLGRYQGCQASLNTCSGSLRTPRSTGQNLWGRDAEEDTNLEISSQDHGPDSEDPTHRQQSHDDATTTQNPSDKQKEASSFLANWQRGHIEKLEQRGQLDLPFAENCNWESGNTDAFKDLQEQQKDTHNFHSHSFGLMGPVADGDRALDGKQAFKALKDSSQGAHTGPRSPSPSTPNKARNGFRGQNSSSEDADHRSAANRGPNNDKAAGKQGVHSVVSASSPRSIDNVRAQHEKKLSGVWKQDEQHDQNSGSSSSSGKISGDTPNTVLPERGQRELKANTSKAMRPKLQHRPEVVKASEPERRTAPESTAAVPLKKRMKLALVETDPFAST